MAAHRCSFSVYLGNVPVLICNNSLQLIMYSEPIPRSPPRQKANFHSPHKHNPQKCIDAELHLKAGIENIHTRLLGLSKKYVDRASKVGNPLILKLLQTTDPYAKGPLAIINNTHI